MASNTQKINAKSVLSYTLLPGIIPRAKEFAGSGFGYLAFLFACAYRTVRILPPTHPYVNPANIGKFGLLNVVGAAANNIQFSRKNLDQIVMFFALLSALVIMFLQFILLLSAFFSGQAFAQTTPTGFTSMFLTQNPATDIAFLMLDYVFGIPGSGGSGAFFGSNALNAVGTAPAGPSPFHYGMHALFNFYNLALLLVAAIIFMYYVLVVVIETAQTGIPFGRRFSKLYAPFRLILAIGLLVPLNYGFNSGQYITLYAAKLGSSFATNGWIVYTNALTNPTGLPDASLVAMPRSPSVEELAYFASVYHACAESYSLSVFTDGTSQNQGGTRGTCIEAYVVENSNTHLFAAGKSTACQAASTSTPGGPVGPSGSSSLYSYSQAKTDFGKNTIEVILGEYDPVKYASFAGGVKPYCGKISIPLTHDNPPYYNGGGGASNTGTQGVQIVEAGYYNYVQTLLSNGAAFEALGNRFAWEYAPSRRATPNVDCYDSNGTLNDTPTCSQGQWQPPQGTVGMTYLQHIQNVLLLMVNNGYTDLSTHLSLQLTPAMQARGWGGAGIWYNNIADMNGAFTGAVYATPSVKQYPMVMEDVKKARDAQNAASGLCDTFTPNLANGTPVRFDTEAEKTIADALNTTYKYFCENPVRDPATTAGTTGGGTTAAPCPAPTAITASGGPARGQSANAFIDAISTVFGINGLFDMRTASCWNAATGQPSIHPLAQLTALGKSLVENAIRSMAMSIGAAFGGGLLGALGSSLGAALDAASSMFVGVATIGLTVGFLLYYILPFLPFIYFFFAVGSWVKSIFEAMVGVPLWALAHLRIDGDGLSGSAAKGGYFLILEIFLRPIITLFGLIGGMAAFTAMAGILNNIFDLVVFNISGAVPGASTATVGGGAVQSFQRGVIDQLFYTVMYAILVYMMATASFKMIDSIPQGIMRWIGSGVPTFNDDKGDPTGGLTQYAAFGGAQISGQVLQGIQTGASGIGRAGGGLINAMRSTGGTTP